MNPRVEHIVAILEDIQSSIDVLYPEDVYDLLDEAIEKLLMMEEEV
jgi:hypothetical protein